MFHILTKVISKNLGLYFYWLCYPHRVSSLTCENWDINVYYSNFPTKQKRL
jgi:hypothetical protein